VLPLLPQPKVSQDGDDDDDESDQVDDAVHRMFSFLPSTLDVTTTPDQWTKGH